MIKLLQSLRRRHHPDVDALSAHLDGRLDAAEAAALDAHVAACEACRAESEGLRAVRLSLSALPDVEHPRSFRLRVADVERVAAKPAARGGTAMRLLPALGGVAALVFVVTLGADLASSGGGSSASKAGGKFASAPQRSESIAFPTMAAADSAGAAAPQPGAPDSSEDGTYAALAPALGRSGDATAAPEAPGAFVPDATPGATRAASAAPTPATAAGVIATDEGTTAAPPAASGNKSADSSPTGELSPDSQRQSGSDDDDGLRAIEIIAAIVAIAAAAGAIALRMRRRGEQA